MVNFVHNIGSSFRRYSLYVSFITSLLVLGLLVGFFEPSWETNDDIAMSMAAHGYGIAAYGSPNLIFSNVLYGHLVRTIPEINGILGYSVATFTVLGVVAWVIMYGLLISGLDYLGALSALILIISRPILFPQFTINAGLLMVSALICWHLYTLKKKNLMLIAGCILAFLSYLVRSHEALLVLAVGCPLLPWAKFKFRSAITIAAITLISVVAVSAVIDRNAYAGDEWWAFHELNHVRAAFTDFGAGSHLLQRPDILEKNNYTANDINLITNWFFVDPNIANPRVLSAMLRDIGFLRGKTYSLSQALDGVRALWHPNFLPIMLAALLLALTRPAWRCLLVWGLCVAAVFVLGLMGRPGVLRVYAPLTCLLLLAPLITSGNRAQASIWSRRMVITGVIIAAIFNITVALTESKALQSSSELVRAGLSNLPDTPLVVWGSVFPFEHVYPPLEIPSTAMKYQLYGLGVFTLAPFSVAVDQKNRGNDMVSGLRSKQGVNILIDDPRKRLLTKYCKEHMQMPLYQIESQRYGVVNLNRLRCG